MPRNYDNEIFFDDNENGAYCSNCGKFFIYEELESYNNEIGYDEYICLKCGSVFND